MNEKNIQLFEFTRVRSHWDAAQAKVDHERMRANIVLTFWDV